MASTILVRIGGTWVEKNLYARVGGDWVLPGGIPSAYDNVNTLSVSLGSEQTVFGPSHFVDSPFHVINPAGTFRGFIGNQNTLLFESSSIDSMTNQGNLPGMGPGSAGAFNECGSWLIGAYPGASGFVRGWYHAERMGGTGGCNYATTQPLKSIAYAESSDYGATWTRQGQVLTGWNNTHDPSVTKGVGDHSVIQLGSNYLMYYYVADVANWGISVARATVASGGGPGTWSKWLSGSFSGTGLGGTETVLSNIAGSYVKKLDNGELMSVSNNWMAISGTDGGVYVAFSKNGTTWVRRTAPLFSIPVDTEIAYASLIPDNGGDTLNSSGFWLYYMKIPPEAPDFGARLLTRRRVTITYP